jgi:hypothetical protein
VRGVKGDTIHLNFTGFGEFDCWGIIDRVKGFALTKSFLGYQELREKLN